jgi:hypothetical protein
MNQNWRNPYGGHIVLGILGVIVILIIAFLHWLGIIQY